MQLVRKESFTTTPWKNGGGITHEAIRVPPAPHPLRWRISVAQIGQSGPFSVLQAAPGVGIPPLVFLAALGSCAQAGTD
jgi:environmental stress-induced protein Ves